MLGVEAPVRHLGMELQKAKALGVPTVPEP